MVRTTDRGILDTLDTIFAGVLVGGLDSNNLVLRDRKREAFKGCLNRFKSNFQEQVFFDNYALYHSIISTLKVSVFSERQLRVIIENNFKSIEESPYIELKSYTTAGNGALSREEKIEAFTLDILDDFYRLSNIEVTEDEFNSACEIYKNFYRDKFYTETIMNMALIMSNNGYVEKRTRGRTRRYHGRLDSNKYYYERQVILDSLDEESGVQHRVLNVESLQRKYDGTDKVRGVPLMDYGIPEIDAVKHKMRRGHIVEFMGPPKGGKTTITAFEVARALMMGLNVMVWPLEGSDNEWESLIIACLIRMDPNLGLSMNKADIDAGMFSTEEEKAAFIAMRQRLYCDPDLGRLSFMTGTAYVETYEESIKVHYDTVNPFDVMVMDSPLNFMSKGGKSKTEMLSEGFMSLKNFVQNKLKTPPLCFITAQVKQAEVDRIRNNPGETMEVTAGGETAETIRTPDEIIGVFSTKAERMSGYMKVFSVASRHNGDFDDFYLGCELNCGYFYSRPELNNAA